MLRILSPLLLFCLTFIVTSENARAGSRVELVEQDGHYQLLRNGEPYQIRGVGGDSSLELLKASGGNSIRTWSTDNLGTLLDQAHALELTVCVGFWIGHERHGFDYTNENAIVDQLDRCLAAVQRYKDHPAVLLWGIGNEMEGAGTNPAIWYAIDHLARECKRIDPDHPTMTVLAELGDHKLSSLERFCPHIDIVGVNSYGGITTLAERYRAAEGSKPYIVTEHGPLGPWEVEKTKWGAPREASSTEKARLYRTGYQSAVQQQSGLCLGSYAFLWGHKQETTATWFGMLLPDGSRLAPLDTMSSLWTGQPVPNRCPEISEIELDRQAKLKPGTKREAHVRATDRENDPLTYEWILRYDSVTIGTGGDYQAEEFTFPNAIEQRGPTAVLTVPEGGGGYRLFAYVRDNHGGAAVANLPLQVDAPLLKIPAPRAVLPLVIYADDMTATPYTPSGYMGNTPAIQMTLDCPDQPHLGKTCLKVEYRASDDWGGVVWQSPANDWDGKLPGGYHLEGASQLEFWARGAEGGETVSFMLGLLKENQLYQDTAHAELKDIQLTADWQRYRIPLKGQNLSRIKTGFAWTVAAPGRPITFYLDDIRYIKKD